MVEEFRQISSESLDIKVILFHPFFVFFDQFIQVLPTTLTCVAISTIVVLGVTSLLIPNLICAVWVTFAIFSIETGVVGLMVFLGIHLDIISMICLIMCVGFSVDFAAHVSYHFIVAHKDDDNEVNARIRSSLKHFGPPIVHSAVSTILGVSGLFFHPSYILTSFAQLMILVIVLGVLHGVILLPVLLSISHR